MKPRALLLGGTGFVGHHLAQQLSDRFDVVATGRAHDVRSPEGMRHLVKSTKPDIAVNLAAITTVRETREDPRLAYDVNFFGTLNVLDALKADRFKGSFLQVSSSEVYGAPAADELPLTEKSELRPANPYSVAKAAGELLCRQWARTSDFRILLARPFTHIGPGQSERFAVARFAREIAEISAGKKKAATIEVGNLSSTRDLTDVRDVVRAYDLILMHGEAGAIYNVCSDRETVMQAILDELIRLSGIEIRVVSNPALMRKSEQPRLRGSFAALNAATSWKPEIPWPNTLSDILAYARSGTNSSVLLVN